MKYSLIIPVYNCEEVICENLKYILEQEYDDYEVLIINDGSIDNTIKVINNLNNKKIKIVNKENGGVSSARNLGIKEASGKYVCFIDADDHISKDFFKILEKYTKNNKYDVIKYNFFIVSQNLDKVKMDFKENEYKKSEIENEVIVDLLTTAKYNAVWNQIIKREFLIKNNILFNSNHQYAEDFEFNLKLYKNIDNMFITANPLYYYNNNSMGITKTYKLNKILKCYDDIYSIFSQNIEYINKLNDDINKKIFQRFINEIEILLTRVINSNESNYNIFYNCISRLKEYIDINNIKIKSFKFKYKIFINHNNIICRSYFIIYKVIYKIYSKIKALKNGI